MTGAAVETIHRAYAAFNRGDWDGADRLAHPGFELQTADRAVHAGTYRGREAARAFFEDLFEPFDEIAVEPEDVFERGDQIVVYLLVRMRPAGSSAFVENRIGHVWTMRDGMIARLAIFPRREDALESVSLET